MIAALKPAIASVTPEATEIAASEVLPVAGPRKRVSKYDPNRWCHNCGATSSPQWRTLVGLVVCNACGIKSKRNPVVRILLHDFG